MTLPWGLYQTILARLAGKQDREINNTEFWHHSLFFLPLLFLTARRSKDRAKGSCQSVRSTSAAYPCPYPVGLLPARTLARCLHPLDGPLGSGRVTSWAGLAAEACIRD